MWPNDFKGSEDFADHVFPGMFKCKALQVVRDLGFMIVILRLRIMFFYSSAKFECEILLFPVTTSDQTTFSEINPCRVLPEVPTQPDR